MFSGQASFCCTSGQTHRVPTIKENNQNAYLTDECMTNALALSYGKQLGNLCRMDEEFSLCQKLWLLIVSENQSRRKSDPWSPGALSVPECKFTPV